MLAEEVEAAGGKVAYVKPHGALYNRMGVDRVVAAAVIEALALQGIGVLVAQAGTAIIGRGSWGWRSGWCSRASRIAAIDPMDSWHRRGDRVP